MKTYVYHISTSNVEEFEMLLKTSELPIEYEFMHELGDPLGDENDENDEEHKFRLIDRDSISDNDAFRALFDFRWIVEQPSGRYSNFQTRAAARAFMQRDTVMDEGESLMSKLERGNKE